MKVVLKPLFDAPLTPDFIEVIKAKLVGKEIKEGDTVEIELLGKVLQFKVMYSEPKLIRVNKNTKIELTEEEIFSLTLDFDEEIKDVFLSKKWIIALFENKVLILNQKGHKIFNQRFDNLREVKISDETIVVIHDDGKKLTIIHI
ncbi:ATPase [Thermococcus sp. MV5]|uniref:DUF6849 domain-containing protein n=1 Tax=Thermococcus sp. MV5 TaxID=1638272 RepID=UPI00143A57FF|nr:ATPase [Thermococcus sp. MV5]NJE26077.1 ATPase [Thermococcus sp. MV5]